MAHFKSKAKKRHAHEWTRVLLSFVQHPSHMLPMCLPSPELCLRTSGPVWRKSRPQPEDLDPTCYFQPSLVCCSLLHKTLSAPASCFLLRNCLTSSFTVKLEEGGGGGATTTPMCQNTHTQELSQLLAKSSWFSSGARSCSNLLEELLLPSSSKLTSKHASVLQNLTCWLSDSVA